MKSLGGPKEFSGKEDEDFHQWSKKTEAFFAGVIKEHEYEHETSMRPCVHSTRHLHWTDVGLFTSRQARAAAPLATCWRMRLT